MRDAHSVRYLVNEASPAATGKTDPMASRKKRGQPSRPHLAQATRSISSLPLAWPMFLLLH